MEDALRAIIEVPEGQVVTGPLWGPQDAHRRLLERRLDIRLNARGDRINVSGATAEQLELGQRVVRELLGVVRGGGTLFLRDVEQAVSLLRADASVSLGELHGKTVVVTHDARAISPKSPNQATYVDAMANNDLVFCVGPAGTGKTYLAMAAAVAAYKAREVKRIILARPAVEAGERLGFLPGTLTEKVNPYLIPLYDALFDLLTIEMAGRLIENNTIEVAPLAFMRGRTLNKAFVILDEAQNTTRDQMKMFLTRLGHNSRAVVTGDTTQIDLQRDQSGLEHAIRVLHGIDGIGVCRLTPVDVVRHPLVQAIVLAYEADAEPRE